MMEETSGSDEVSGDTDAGSVGTGITRPGVSSILVGIELKPMTQARCDGRRGVLRTVVTSDEYGIGGESVSKG